jgi:hypothetical protein
MCVFVCISMCMCMYKYVYKYVYVYVYVCVYVRVPVKVIDQVYPRGESSSICLVTLISPAASSPLTAAAITEGVESQCRAGLTEAPKDRVNVPMCVCVSGFVCVCV